MYSVSLHIAPKKKEKRIPTLESSPCKGLPPIPHSKAPIPPSLKITPIPNHQTWHPLPYVPYSHLFMKSTCSRLSLQIPYPYPSTNTVLLHTSIKNSLPYISLPNESGPSWIVGHGVYFIFKYVDENRITYERQLKKIPFVTNNIIAHDKCVAIDLHPGI